MIWLEPCEKEIRKILNKHCLVIDRFCEKTIDLDQSIIGKFCVYDSGGIYFDFDDGNDYRAIEEIILYTIIEHPTKANIIKLK